MFFASTSHFLKNDWTPIIVSELCISLYSISISYICVFGLFSKLYFPQYTVFRIFFISFPILLQ